MITNPRRLFAVTLVIGFVSTASFLSRPVPRSTGVLEGELFVPLNVSSAFPSCGACHDPNPNANGPVVLDLSPGQLSLDNGATIPVNVKVTGGPGIGLGGFSLSTNSGSFIPGTNTRVSPVPPTNSITHTDKFGNQWSFSYAAPTMPGLIEWTAVGQSVNADLTTANDSWGFYGPDSSVGGVPLRLYVNAPNMTAVGAGCTGDDGHTPVLGAPAAATVGQSFSTSMHALPPNAVVFCAAGDRVSRLAPLPVDLALIGAPGCLVQINLIFVQSGAATGTGSGGGSATFAWRIPNNPALRGAMIDFQGLVVDSKANQFGLTVTNALSVTVQ